MWIADLEMFSLWLIFSINLVHYKNNEFSNTDSLCELVRNKEIELWLLIYLYIVLFVIPEYTVARCESSTQLLP